MAGGGFVMGPIGQEADGQRLSLAARRSGEGLELLGCPCVLSCKRDVHAEVPIESLLFKN